MANLLIETDVKIKPLKKLARVLFKELGQKIPLKAELVFVEPFEIRQLNAQRRGVDKVTDVLSFPSIDEIRGTIFKKGDYPTETDCGRLFLGSIAICAEQARKQAQEYGHGEEHEFVYLTLHGLLHLFGYDHITDEDKTQMRGIEKTVMTKIGMGEYE